MCECLEYDDGSLYLCAVCADEYRMMKEQIKRLRKRVEELESSYERFKADHPEALRAAELELEIERLRYHVDKQDEFINRLTSEPETVDQIEHSFIQRHRELEGGDD